MNKKIFITLLISCLFFIICCSCSFAENNMLMNAGNTVGNAAVTVKNAISNTATDLTNGGKALVQDTGNTAKTIGNDTRNTVGATGQALGNTAYTTTRTATNSNFLGINNNAWTWLILAIVGIIIIALIWYYSSRYEHKNYSND